MSLGGNGTSGGVSKPARKVAERQLELGGKLRGAAAPAVDEGLDQFLNLLSTGGVGARVPIISRAVAGQEGATRRARENVASLGARGNVGDSIINRLMTQIGTAGGSRAAGIGPGIAGGLSVGNILNALTAGRGGAGAIRQGISSLAGGFRPSTPNVAAQNLGGNLANLVQFGGAGGFGQLPRFNPLNTPFSPARLPLSA